MIPARWPASLLFALFCGCPSCPDMVPDQPPDRRRALPAAAPAPERGVVRFVTSAATEAALSAHEAGGQALVVLALLGDLYRLDPAGGEAQPLTRGPAYDAEPALSQDGKLLLFQSDRDGAPGIYVLSLEDPKTAPRRLTPRDNHRYSLPVFSKDGQDVVCVRQRDAVWELLRVPLTGGAPQVLRSARGELTGLTVLPSGRLLYALAQRTPEPRTEIYLFPEHAPRQTLPGTAGGLVPHPGGGILVRLRDEQTRKEALAAVSLEPPAPPQILRPLAATRSLPRPGWLPKRGCYVLADEGRLRLLRPDGTLAGEIGFRARVALPVAPRSDTPVRLGGAADKELFATADHNGSYVPHDRALLLPSGGFLYAAGGRILRTASAANEPDLPVTTAGELAFDPALSADGKTLVYCRLGHGGTELVRRSLVAKGAPAVLFAAPSLSAPVFGADSKTVVFTVSGPPFGGAVPAQLFRVPAAGGTAVPLPVRGGAELSATVVPGGLCVFAADRPLSLLRPDGSSRPLLALAEAPIAALCAPGGKAIAYVQHGSAFLAPLHLDRPVADGEGKRLFQTPAHGAASLAFCGDRLTIQTGRGVAVVPVAATLLSRKAEEAAQDLLPLHPGLAARRPPPVYLRDVTLLDPENRRSLPKSTLVLADGRIAWVGPDGKAPPPPGDAQVIEGTGRFLMPGLIEMHGHLSFFDPRAYLAYGITTVRDADGGSHRALDYQVAGELGLFPLPRAVATAAVPALRGEAEVERSLAVLPADVLRIDGSLPRNQRQAVMRRAQQLGLPVSVTADTLEETVTAVQDGAAMLEPRSLPGVSCEEDLLLLLARSGVARSSLLHRAGLAEQLLSSSHPVKNPVLFELAVPPEALRAQQAAARDPVPFANFHEVQLAERLSQLRRQYRAGAALVAGSDAGALGSFPGISLLWELQALHRAGFSAWQVLRMATIDAAFALPSQEIGRVLPGARADLILLAGNPLEDLSNLERVVVVVRGGQVYRPELLVLR